MKLFCTPYLQNTKKKEVLATFI